jgi:hypothetical protein
MIVNEVVCFCRFRNKVLLQKPKGSQSLVSNMQQLFALLKFSSSTVIYPEESFHAALRPPYFVRGQQEDGFLYLRFFQNLANENKLLILLKFDCLATFWTC